MTLDEAKTFLDATPKILSKKEIIKHMNYIKIKSQFCEWQYQY
jgi:hypothetical protein